MWLDISTLPLLRDSTPRLRVAFLFLSKKPSIQGRNIMKNTTLLVLLRRHVVSVSIALAVTFTPYCTVGALYYSMGKFKTTKPNPRTDF